MLMQRIMTAVVLAPLVLWAVFTFNPFGFALFVGFIIVLGAWEWANMAGLADYISRIKYAAVTAVVLIIAHYLSSLLVITLGVCWWLVAAALIKAYPGQTERWSGLRTKYLIGWLILVPLWSSLCYLRTHQLAGHEDVSSLWLVVYPLLIVWGADIGAYVVGKQLGKRKLAPNVSPGKSWEGAVGGLSTCIIISILATLALNETLSFSIWLGLFSLFAGAFSIVGDLTESMFKRQRGIKDSSQLLPGHGGVLDRIDGLTAAVPMFAFALIVFNELA